MWSPTHIQVTVQKARGLLVKGKNNTNNCFVTIALGKEKYQTSVKDKAEPNVSWNEECELKIPDHGNRAELILTCLHRNNLGIDEFLGQATMPLNAMDVYDRPRSKWYKLESKPGKEKKNKDRGELEVRITFNVKSGSMTDLSKKEKLKSSSKTSVGGSLLSINTLEKRKSLKKFAKSLGSKMHLSSKKKNKDGDDMSINGSFNSLSTPNDGGRSYGQRAGEADPGVISEDEDEFVFDNLSHKSSGSSLNVRANGGLQPPPNSNYAPRHPSPLLNSHNGGKKTTLSSQDDDVIIDPELEAISNDFRTRTLPPPSKPPRTPHTPSSSSEPNKIETSSTIDVASSLPIVEHKEDFTDLEPEFNEWEKKLYGGKNLEVASSNSLKRRSWEYRVPLPTTNEEQSYDAVKPHSEQTETKEPSNKVSSTLVSEKCSSDSDTTSSSESDDEEPGKPMNTNEEEKSVPVSAAPKVAPPNQLALETKASASSKRTNLNISLISPDSDKINFDQFNASFAKYEQNNSAIIFNTDHDKNKAQDEIVVDVANKIETPSKPAPKAMPRSRNTEDLKAQTEQFIEEEKLEENIQIKTADVSTSLEELDKKNENMNKVNTKKLIIPDIVQEPAVADDKFKKEIEIALQQEEEQQRRDAKRHEEDQKILNFVKRSTSLNEQSDYASSPSNGKPIDDAISAATIVSGNGAVDKRETEKRIGKYKYMNKRDENSSSPKTAERIIIGHERTSTHGERRSEITAALTRKYEGKSREELMLIANGMENEALLQRQRVKELEDYLDNLLLRVMETHPKILQNPYSRTTSAKSG